MSPTLRELDLLEVVPYHERAMKPGDVIVFRETDSGRNIIHRVVDILPQGIHTRGDINDGEDPCVLQHSEVIGKVVAAWRGQSRRRVLGGLAGRAACRLARVVRALDGIVSHLLRPIYQRLVRSGILRRWLPTSYRPRVVSYEANGGCRLQLMMNGRLVGRYDHDLRRWIIRRPFKLFVDEKELPHPQGARELGCMGAREQ